MDLAPNMTEAEKIIWTGPHRWDLTVPWVRQYWSVELIKRYHAKGFSYVNLTIQDSPPTFEGVQEEVKAFQALCEPHTELCFAKTLADIQSANAEGKLAIGLNVQDTELVHEDLDRLEFLKNFGVMHMLLAYQVRNKAADGCAEPSDAGLSRFGRRLVEKMNEVGMVVDLSHTGRRSTLDAIEHSTSPVIFSHSGVRKVFRHMRNIDDEQIKGCADTGGVIGVVGIGAFLGTPDATSESVFQHIDHIVQLVGADHVGIGTDYIDDITPVWDTIREHGGDAWIDPEGTQPFIGGAWGPDKLVELVQIMLDHGYPETAIQGVLGSNFHRVYAQIHRQGESE